MRIHRGAVYYNMKAQKTFSVYMSFEIKTSTLIATSRYYYYFFILCGAMLICYNRFKGLNRFDAITIVFSRTENRKTADSNVISYNNKYYIIFIYIMNDTP